MPSYTALCCTVCIMYLLLQFLKYEVYILVLNKWYRCFFCLFPLCNSMREIRVSSIFSLLHFVNDRKNFEFSVFQFNNKFFKLWTLKSKGQNSVHERCVLRLCCFENVEIQIAIENLKIEPSAEIVCHELSPIVCLTPRQILVNFITA